MLMSTFPCDYVTVYQDDAIGEGSVLGSIFCDDVIDDVHGCRKASHVDVIDVGSVCVKVFHDDVMHDASVIVVEGQFPMLMS